MGRREWNGSAAMIAAVGSLTRVHHHGNPSSPTTRNCDGTWSQFRLVGDDGLPWEVSHLRSSSSNNPPPSIQFVITRGMQRVIVDTIIRRVWENHSPVVDDEITAVLELPAPGPIFPTPHLSSWTNGSVALPLQVPSFPHSTFVFVDEWLWHWQPTRLVLLSTSSSKATVFSLVLAVA